MPPKGVLPRRLAVLARAGQHRAWRSGFGMSFALASSETCIGHVWHREAVAQGLWPA
jgi:hypothetical protein